MILKFTHGESKKTEPLSLQGAPGGRGDFCDTLRWEGGATPGVP